MVFAQRNGEANAFTLHGREYALPKRPTIVVCVDGFDPEYLEHGIQDGILPTFARLVKNGFHTTSHAVMPTFTNPNNVSIITGVPTAVHGIAGNFYLDPETLEERMVVDDTLLIGSTILEQMVKRGVRVAAITAKDKLRAILSHGIIGKCICFSAQFADQCTVEKNGIADVEQLVGRETPSQYSGDLSLFVLDAGVKLLEQDRADLFYLTLSDFIQHKYAPGSPESNEFLSALDSKVGRLVELGAVVGITGDHGMSDKSLSVEAPNVLFVQDELEANFGTGCGRVICPITDPFVRHHGALGGFVRIHVAQSHADKVEEMIKHLRTLPQVEFALNKDEGSSRFQMPRDREGDIVVVGVQNAALGAKREEHDLENLKGHRLRTHGSLAEQDVPLIMSEKIRPERVGEVGGHHWRNFDAFDLVLNWSQQ